MTEKHLHRRNLPHLYLDEGIYFITYRLANSIPADKVAEIKRANDNGKDMNDEKFERLLKKYDKFLDSGTYGNKYLADPEIADICKYSLQFSDGRDCKLICYCIMPNHIHLVIELLSGNKGVSKIMQSIKRTSARESNKVLKRAGKFWQDESYDRLVRDEKELYFIIKYVLLNPVNAGLVENWTDWKYTYCLPDYIVL